MDTILNLGLNDTVVKGLAAFTNNPRFAYDSYRRFIQMFSDVVMEQPKSEFEKIIDAKKEEKGVKLDTELDADDMMDLVSRFKALYKAQKGEDFPSEPRVPAHGGGQGSVPFLGQSSRERIPPHE